MKIMKILMPFVALFIIVILAGCGASKAYVDQAVADERARNQAAVGDVDKDVKANKAVLERLQSLTAQLEQKTDMAINQAKGYEDYQVIWEGEIFFDFNSSSLTVEAREIMDQVGDKMTADRSSILEIAGYTDPQGSKAYNMELGNRRAAAAKYYLVDDYGVNLYRIFMVSYGENKAISGGDGTTSYAKQRKVMLKLWGKQ